MFKFVIPGNVFSFLIRRISHLRPLALSIYVFSIRVGQFDTFFLKNPEFQRFLVRRRPKNHIGTKNNALAVFPIGAFAF